MYCLWYSKIYLFIQNPTNLFANRIDMRGIWNLRWRWWRRYYWLERRLWWIIFWLNYTFLEVNFFVSISKFTIRRTNGAFIRPYTMCIGGLNFVITILTFTIATTVWECWHSSNSIQYWSCSCRTNIFLLFDFFQIFDHFFCQLWYLKLSNQTM